MRQVDGRHAATADFAGQAIALAEGDSQRSVRAVRQFGRIVRAEFVEYAVETAPLPIGSGEQRLDFDTKLAVAPAGLIQVGDALMRSELYRDVKDLADSLRAIPWTGRPGCVAAYLARPAVPIGSFIDVHQRFEGRMSLQRFEIRVYPQTDR